MANKTYKELIDYVNQYITNFVIIRGNQLNTLYKNIFDSFHFHHSVADDAARNSIVKKKKGMLVFVEGSDSIFFLSNDLSTWQKINVNGYTAVQLDALLEEKVDKIDGKGLSQEDFTSVLKEQLINFESTDYLTKNIRLVTADYVVQNNDFTILVDATLGPVVITLFDAEATENDKKFINIVKVDSSENQVNVRCIDFDASESNSVSDSTNDQLIDGQFYVDLNDQFEGLNLQAFQNNFYSIYNKKGLIKLASLSGDLLLGVNVQDMNMEKGINITNSIPVVGILRTNTSVDNLGSNIYFSVPGNYLTAGVVPSNITKLIQIPVTLSWEQNQILDPTKKFQIATDAPGGYVGNDWEVELWGYKKTFSSL